MTPGHPTVEPLTDRDAVFRGVALWNAHNEAFRIRDELVAQNVLAPVTGVDADCYGALDGDGELRAFAVLKRPVAGPGGPSLFDAGTAWLSLFAFDAAAGSGEGRTAGTALVDHVAAVAARGGAETLRFGGDPGNLLAGIPDGLHPAYREVLSAAGFDAGPAVFDLQRGLPGFDPPAAVRATREEWPGLRVRPATGREHALYAFIDDQFPGRWAAEARHVCRVPGGAADYWLLEQVEAPEEGDPAADGVVGFVRANRHDGTYLGPNVNWGWRLAERYCGVGPLGVHADCRGRGWGLAMVAAVLERLRDAGYAATVVDWTDLPGYYERLGFDRWRRYETATLDL